MNKPEYIIIHHSLTKDTVLQDFYSIRDYHKKKGWWTIGYHRVLERSWGNIYIHNGRSIKDTGAHALGFNKRSIGICVVGNYDKTKLPKDFRVALINEISCLMFQYRIPLRRVIGHWETYKLRNKRVIKSCPGKLFSMVRLRKDITKIVSKYKIIPNKTGDSFAVRGISDMRKLIKIHK